MSRIPALQKAKATWLEEPFYAHAFKAYSDLAANSGAVGIAGGEGAHTQHMAMNLIDFGGVKFIQVDSARIGGIGPSKIVADHAVNRDVTFVNHTFTSHLALSASMQAFAGLETHRICEYPVEPKQVAWDLSIEHIDLNADGEILTPDQPGLGINVNEIALAPYLRQVEIKIDGEITFLSPKIGQSAIVIP
jgi:L-alanine-DL-glutamate epimerase-like enolase superfamily enzyme